MKLYARKVGSLWFIGPRDGKGGAVAGTFLKAWRLYLKRAMQE